MSGTVRSGDDLLALFAPDRPDFSITPDNVQDVIVTVLSVASGISAAGTNQASATPLTRRWNIVTTVPTGTGVILPAGIAVVVSNRGAIPLLVYPPIGAKIESLTANAPFSLAPGQDISTAPDPADPTQVYAVANLNLATLGTSLPSAAGVPWNNGGVLAIS